MLIYEKQIIPNQEIFDGSYLANGEIFEVFQSGSSNNADALIDFATNGVDDTLVINCDGVTAAISDWEAIENKDDEVVGLKGHMNYFDAEDTNVYNVEIVVEDDTLVATYTIEEEEPATVITPEDNPDLFARFADFEKSALRKIYGTMENVPLNDDVPVDFDCDGSPIPLCGAFLKAYKATLVDDTHGGMAIKSELEGFPDAGMPVFVYVDDNQIIPPTGDVVEIAYEGEPFADWDGVNNPIFYFNSGNEGDPEFTVVGTTNTGTTIDVTDSCEYNPGNGTPANEIPGVTFGEGTFDLIATYNGISITIPIAYNWVQGE